MLLPYAAPSIITIIVGGNPCSSKAQGRKAMRMLLRVSVPVEAGNAAAKAGTLGPTIEKILADLKPEAAYFFADDNGNRSGSSCST
jgi:hypothetical protein